MQEQVSCVPIEHSVTSRLLVKSYQPRTTHHTSHNQPASTVPSHNARAAVPRSEALSSLLEPSSPHGNPQMSNPTRH